MAKVGRNEPCPCGSGRKYKKCCLRADEAAAAAARTTPEVLALDLRSAGPPPTPYTVARMFERSEQWERLQRSEPARAATFWTTDRVAALGTGAIVERLASLGIGTDPEGFRELAAGGTSAWALSEVWLDRRETGAPPLRDREDDFVGLAACELWKRWCPETPSIEMLDDWMQQGYDDSLEGDAVAASERWLGVWDAIHPRLTPEMRTCNAARPVFEGTQALFNWVQDLAMELQNAGRDRPDLAERGAAFCRQVLDQFTGENALFRTNFRCDLGDLLYLAGHPEEGERTLAQVVADHPTSAAGYARLADQLARDHRPDGPAPDPARAIELLEAARRCDDAEHWSVEERLAWIRSHGRSG